MSWQIRPSSVSQQLEAILEKREQLRSREGIGTSGSQFDRQRDSVQAPADLGHDLDVGFVQFKTLMSGGRSLDEELDRRELNCLGNGEGFPLQRCGKGTEAPDGFAIYAERFSAGGGPIDLATSKQTSNEGEGAKILTEAEIRRRECENIFVVLQKTGWKIKGADGAAQLLGVKPTTLISRIKRMGIVRPG
jgi:hypothetical protein